MKPLKLTIYTALLLLTISGELLHLAYAVSTDQVSLEISNDTKGEQESEETKDVGEDASEIPTSQIIVDQFSNPHIALSNGSIAFVDLKYSRISTPPPDYL